MLKSITTIIIISVITSTILIFTLAIWQSFDSSACDRVCAARGMVTYSCNKERVVCSPTRPSLIVVELPH